MKTWFKMAKKDQTAQVSIYDEIGGWGVTAAQFRRDLEALGKFDRLELTINSPGGSVTEGMAVFNLLKDLKQEITVIISGLAASMASVIAMAGTKITIHENSYLMIHNPWASLAGEANEHRKVAELLDSMKEQALTCYQRHCNLSAEELGKMLDAETWLSGKEAVAKGFAGEVLPTLDAAACVKFDLAKFKNIPEGAKLFMKSATDTTSQGEQSEPSGKSGKSDVTDPAALLADLQAKFTGLQTENVNLKQQVEAERVARLAAENQVHDFSARLENLLGGGFRPKEEIAAPSGWPAAVKECGDDYVKARQQYPELYRQYREECRRKRGEQ